MRNSEDMRHYADRLEAVEAEIKRLKDEKRRIYAEAYLDGHDKTDLATLVRDVRQVKAGCRVYFVEFPRRELIKIGISRGLRNRLYALNADAGEAGNVIASLPGTYPIEGWCHVRMKPWEVEAEWYQRCDQSLAAVNSLIEQVGETYKTPPTELLLSWYRESIREAEVSA